MVIHGDVFANTISGSNQNSGNPGASGDQRIVNQFIDSTDILDEGEPV